MKMTGTKIVLIVGAVLLVIGAVTAGVILGTQSDDPPAPSASMKQALEILEQMPVIDGHNDFPWNLRNYVFNDLTKVNFNSRLDTPGVEPWASATNSHTDIPRLRLGRVGAQFWVAYTSCTSQYKDSVEQTYEQIDVIKRLVKQYPADLQFATSAAEIEDSIRNQKVGSLIGVEGGHSIQSSFGVLRTMYELGVRYMTLTHACNTPWADSSPVDDPNTGIVAEHGGLSPYGIEIVHEMNRLGMMVDLSHVSDAAMKSALRESKAPVIFSHSSSYTKCNHHRNVRDDVLQLVNQTNSLVMVNFYSLFIQCDPNKNATLQDVIEHINHILDITGPDHIGIGGDYDGVTAVPKGLEDVSKYPDLIAALIDTGRWSSEDLQKLTGKNLLRVFRDVERIRDGLQAEAPIQKVMTKVAYENAGGDLTCATAKLPEESTKAKRSMISDDFQEL